MLIVTSRMPEFFRGFFGIDTIFVIVDGRLWSLEKDGTCGHICPIAGISKGD